MQRAMVLASVRAPSSGVYVLQRISECRDRLDLGRLKESWKRVAARRASLRTAIHVDGGTHGRMIAPVAEIPWREVEWADHVPERLFAFLAEDAERGFAFENGVPVRFTLAQTSQGSILIWSVHHALLDGRSVLIVWRELFAIYDSLSAGSEASLAEPQDFSAHLDWLELQDRSRAESYWRRQWQGVTETTEYIVDRIRLAGSQTESGYAKEAVAMSEPLTRQLRACAAERAVTLNTLIQGAWALLLGRYSGRQDIVFGVTRDGRRSSVPWAEQMVGLFINTLPFRVAVIREPRSWIGLRTSAPIGWRCATSNILRSTRFTDGAAFRLEYRRSTQWSSTITNPRQRRYAGWAGHAKAAVSGRPNVPTCH